MAKITMIPYENTQDGKETILYTLTNHNNARVSICNFGGIITSLVVPDRDEVMTDVVLGYQHMSGYEDSSTYFGALVGRCANRIADGKFKLNEQEYQLVVNNGKNHLHGGIVGFDRRFWDVKVVEQSLHLELTASHMEENYPGNIKISVDYTLDDENCLTITYNAVSDQDTLCNLTNHTYFNLGGHDSGTIENQQMKIYASSYLPIDSSSIPTGEIASVEDTAFDFREFKSIGKDINESVEQIEIAGGFDHNFVLDKEIGTLSLAAEAYAPQTGITLKCETTQAGVQFYTGNSISSKEPIGKKGVRYDRRHGFCLETQGYPDAINHKNFPAVVLKAQEKYHEVTKYRFGIR